jgi:hypothetical protein
MISIEKNGTVYKFPEKWSELTIGTFQKLSNLSYDTAGLDDIDLTVKTICLLGNIEEEELNELPFTEFCKLRESAKFINSEFKQDPINEFNLDGVDYILMEDINKISTGEFIDLDTLINDKDETVDNLHLIMAIMYRPKKESLIEKYNSSTVEGRSLLFKEKLTCDYAISSLVFSLALGLNYLENLQDSLEQSKENLNEIK